MGRRDKRKAIGNGEGRDRKQWFLVIAKIYHRCNGRKEGIRAVNINSESVTVDGRRKMNKVGKRKSERETLKK